MFRLIPNFSWVIFALKISSVAEGNRELYAGIDEGKRIKIQRNALAGSCRAGDRKRTTKKRSLYCAAWWSAQTKKTGSPVRKQNDRNGGCWMRRRATPVVMTIQQNPALHKMFSLSKCKINSINGIFSILLLNLIREAAFGPIIGEIVTDYSQGVFMCDQIECPTATFRCFVSKRPNDANTQLERANICYSEDDTILKKSLSTEQLLPGDIGAEVEINITRNGQIQVTRTGGNIGYQEVDPKQYDEQLKYIEQVRQNVEDLNKNIEKSLSDIHTSISQSLSFLQ